MKVYNKKAVTLMELMIAIALVGTIVLAAAVAQKSGIDFVKSTSERIRLQNKAHLGVEKVVRTGREAESFNISSGGNAITFEFADGSEESYTFDSDELENLTGSFEQEKADKRFVIHIDTVDGEDMSLDTKVALRKNIVL